MLKRGHGLSDDKRGVKRLSLWYIVGFFIAGHHLTT